MSLTFDLEPRAVRVALPARGGEMAGLAFGAEGPPEVVFCHANGFNARTYRSILAPLASELRVLAVDMRGHGASTLPAEPEAHAGWYGFRDDLIALIDTVAVGPVVLAGHSMGGTTCLLTSEARPDLVRALALFDPVIFDAARAAQDERPDNPLAQGADRRRAVFPDRAAVVAAYTGRGAFRTWGPGQLEDYVAGGFRDLPDGQVGLACAPAWEAANFRIHRYDPWSAFRAVQAPTRMLRAEIGSTARIDEGLDIITANPMIRWEMVPGTSHFLPMERPELVRETVSELAR
ncbi:alpha/beta fold hydrolase [Phenylobacterium sp.]|uniref:alpha/beta fold hydrolase n=1 Tax=Phenylobacterium sp. TaxID=1871053 RepID=UPI0037C6585B